MWRAGWCCTTIRRTAGRCTRSSFRFEVAFALDDDALEQSFTVVNPVGRVQVCVGAHPAFVWPLGEGAAKTGTRAGVRATGIGAQFRRLNGGLLRAGGRTFADPGGTSLALAPGLFTNDAVILDQVASRSG